MRTKIYGWHRRLSLIIAVPVLLWASSGFMHPIMTNIRPDVATQGLAPMIVDSSKILVPLQKALLTNHIDSFAGCRLVHIDTNWFYQVRVADGREPVYLSTAMVTRFTNEYNFTDKRLPVWKISYGGHAGERVYVETSTGKLSKRISDRDLVEGYSFAFLHKHEFMAWGGKGLKDVSTMFWAMAQVAMVTVGLILYFRLRRRRSRSSFGS